VHRGTTCSRFWVFDVWFGGKCWCHCQGAFCADQRKTGSATGRICNVHFDNKIPIIIYFASFLSASCPKGEILWIVEAERSYSWNDLSFLPTGDYEIGLGVLSNLLAFWYGITNIDVNLRNNNQQPNILKINDERWYLCL